MKKHFNSHSIKWLKTGSYSGLSKMLVLIFMIFFSSIIKANNDIQSVTQTRIVSGIIKDTQGETLPGVSVVQKGSTNGTVTDENGKYSIEVTSNATVLTFFYIGKKEVEITVGNKKTVDVVMEDDATVLEEVVIQTGYMTQKKADLTGSLALAGAEDIAKNPSPNVMKSLQGKLSGVLVTSNGNPADDVRIQIRGVSSLSIAYDPLIVVDGLPSTINLRDINSMDIESVQVLKDAASASIYGSRAAGGVILIETKKGKNGVVINYDGSVGFSKLPNPPRMLNTDQYGRAIWQATVNDGTDPAASIRIYNYKWHRDANGIPVLDSSTPIEWMNDQHTMHSADTDWFKEVTQTGVQINQQLTVSSGTDKSKSMFSLNYLDNTGTEIYTHFKRYSARMNSEYDLIKNRLKVGENFTVSYLNYNRQLGASDRDRNAALGIRTTNDAVYNAIIMPSIVPVHTTDGGWGGTAMKLGMDDYNNPVRLLAMENDNNENFMKALGSTYLSLVLVKDLTFKTQFGIDYSNAYHRWTDHTWQEGGGRQDDINGVENREDHVLNYTWTNTLTYSLNTNKHSLDALLGTESYRYTNDGFRAYRDEIKFENKDYAILNAATGNKKITEGWAGENTLLSYFAKANYVYDSKYLLSATIRYDGASKFGENKRFGTFPAFSAGWRIKNESFMEDKLWLSDLKLRASWGMNGNSNIPTDALTTNYVTDYNSTSYAIGGNASGGLPSGYRRRNLGNADLQWESSVQTDLGVDFGFWGQRINGSFDYFYKTTNNMLFLPAYIATLGEEAYRWENAGKMTNKGIELSLSYTNDYNSEFRYTLTGNLSSYRNKIIELPQSVIYDYGGNGLKDNIIGRPKNSLYGLVADGIFKTQEEVDNSPEQQGKGLGRIRYKDLNGDGRIDEAYDRTWIGISDPDFMAGFNFNASYKGFDMTAFFQGVFGGTVYNYWKEYSDFWNITVQNDKNHPTRIMDAWSLSNPGSDIPALSRRNENGELRLSTYFLENGSYVKLRTLEFGYTLPKEIAKKASMQRLRFYVSGHNLLTLKKSWGDDKFTGPDPENPDFAYRVPLTLTFGVNLTF